MIKVKKITHIFAACKFEQIKKQREENKKKASVKEVSAVVETPPAAPAAEVPAAVLNSVHAVAQTQQSAGYVFNPERFTEHNRFNAFFLLRTLQLID